MSTTQSGLQRGAGYGRGSGSQAGCGFEVGTAGVVILECQLEHKQQHSAPSSVIRLGTSAQAAALLNGFVIELVPVSN